MQIKTGHNNLEFGREINKEVWSKIWILLNDFFIMELINKLSLILLILHNERLSNMNPIQRSTLLFLVSFNKVLFCFYFLIIKFIVYY